MHMTVNDLNLTVYFRTAEFSHAITQLEKIRTAAEFQRQLMQKYRCIDLELVRL